MTVQAHPHQIVLPLQANREVLQHQVVVVTAGPQGITEGRRMHHQLTALGKGAELDRMGAQPPVLVTGLTLDDPQQFGELGLGDPRQTGPHQQRRYPRLHQ